MLIYKRFERSWNMVKLYIKLYESLLRRSTQKRIYSLEFRLFRLRNFLRWRWYWFGKFIKLKNFQEYNERNGKILRLKIIFVIQNLIPSWIFNEEWGSWHIYIIHLTKLSLLVIIIIFDFLIACFNFFNYHIES